MLNNVNYHVIELGVRNFKEIKKEYLEVGEVGYVVVIIRDVKEVHVGDIIILVENFVLELLLGYKRKKFVFFIGFYFIDIRDYVEFKKSLDKILLSDSLLIWE